VRRAGFVKRRRSIPERESFVHWQSRTEVRIKRFMQRCSRTLSCTQSPVTAVTDRQFFIGDTSIVNMVRKAGTKALFEPGDARQQWKGEAAASLV
jgi:hypothetical protein